MMYDIEVKVSLKPGMLNPEATTIQRSLALLGYGHVSKTIMQSNYPQLHN